MLSRGAGADEQDVARTAFGDETLVKPAISAGAFGAAPRAAAASAQAREHLAGLVREGDALVQPHGPKVESGEVSLMYFGGVLSHAVRKLPAGGDFRVRAEHGGTLEPHRATYAERSENC